MKKLICFIVTVTLLLSSVSTAYAKNGGPVRQNDHQKQNHVCYDWHGNKRDKEEEHTFWINNLTILTYGKYKIPVNVIEDGMNATVSLDTERGILTVTGEYNKIIILDYYNKTITVNGVKDYEPNVFKLRYNKNMKALLKYLGKQLGYQITYHMYNITVKSMNKKRNDNIPGTTQDIITITPVGSSVVANTLNTTTQFFTAIASITAGRATGGYAVLYVGDVAVAYDNSIAATDTAVTFTTSDGSPTNTELQSIVPRGGKLSVRLYNSGNILINTITSDKTLLVDYTAPTITNAIAAVYSAQNSTITISVTGAGAVNDIVDVKKISLYDTALNKTYQLTNSVGAVSSSNTITIKLSAADQQALSAFGALGVTMYIAPGSLITDKAGNAAAAFSTVQLISVTVNNSSGTTQSTIAVTPVGSSVVADTLNSTTLYLTAVASITAGRATGGHAVLFIGGMGVAVDNFISATDTTVTFTTSDGTPTNAELQSIVPRGGALSVNLYNSSNILISTITSNKTLTVDYVPPTISSVTAAVYSKYNRTITISAIGAGAVNDLVDVKKISLYDTALNKMYQLTDSTGVVSSNTTITIKLGIADQQALSAYGASSVYLHIAVGPLITDTAGNAAASFEKAQMISVTVTP